MSSCVARLNEVLAVASLVLCLPGQSGSLVASRGVGYVGLPCFNLRLPPAVAPCGLRVYVGRWP